MLVTVCARQMFWLTFLLLRFYDMKGTWCERFWVWLLLALGPLGGTVAPGLDPKKCLNWVSLSFWCLCVDVFTFCRTRVKGLTSTPRPQQCLEMDTLPSPYTSESEEAHSGSAEFSPRREECCEMPLPHPVKEQSWLFRCDFLCRVHSIHWSQGHFLPGAAEGQRISRALGFASVLWLWTLARVRLGACCCSVSPSCPTLCDPVDCRMPGFPVLHCLPELAQTHVHRVGDAIQPCHPLLPPSPPAFNLSQRQGFSSELALRIRWPKDWSFSFSISLSNEYSGLVSFRIDCLDLLAVQGTLKSLLQHHSSKASSLRRSAFLMVQLSHLYMTTG